jgi:glucan 1,4-alpha-glucosidase
MTRLTVALPVLALLAAPLTAIPASAATTAATGATAPTGAAPDGPGATSYLDLGRKDCLGTATSATSKVWYTVAGGMLSDVYYPTTDNTDNKTVQYIVTDGHSFTDLQERDMTYTARALDDTGMACQVTATSAKHGYRLVTDFITDPSRDSVVMHTVYEALTASAHGYHVYVRYNALINGTGGGGSQNGGAGTATIDPATTGLVSYNTGTQSSTPQRDYQVPVYGTLVADRPFEAETSGFAGQPSDGLTQLDAGHALATSYQDAGNGNVTQTAEVDTSRGQFTLALGYAKTEARSVSAAAGSATTPFAATYARYAAGWRGYDATLRRPPTRFPGADATQSQKMTAQYWTSANVIRATADKEFPGAVVSSLADPWGQATTANSESNGLPSVDVNYRVIFSRDFYETFTGFLADGDLTTARQMVRYIFGKVELPDGSFPRDSLVNGAVASDNYVLEPDEQAFGLIMAWESGLGGDRELYVDHVRPAADFLVAHGPVYGDERWEDQAGYSPSTIATEIAGLVAAGRIAAVNGDAKRAALYDATADYYQRNVTKWTVTTDGPYSAQPYFLRLSKTGDPNAATVYNLGNGSIDADQRTVLDDGFLELARLGELPANSALFASSLKVADSVLETGTPSGPGYHRYSTLYQSENGVNVPVTGSADGYGDCYAPAPMQCPLTGRPWIPWFIGTGHVWPLLNGERGEQDLQTGDPSGAAAQLDTMANLATGAGMIPEQDWEEADVPPSAYGSDPTTASIGFTDGQPTGSAGEITWAEAAYVRLARDIAAGSLADQPAVVRDRYISRTPPAAAPLTVSATAPVTAGAPVTVTGSAAPGATVVLAATLSPAGATDPNAVAHSAAVPTDIAVARAGQDGSYSATLPLTTGTWVITAATATASASGYAQATVTAS